MAACRQIGEQCLDIVHHDAEMHGAGIAVGGIDRHAAALIFDEFDQLAGDAEIEKGLGGAAAGIAGDHAHAGAVMLPRPVHRHVEDAGVEGEAGVHAGDREADMVERADAGLAGHAQSINAHQWKSCLMKFCPRL